MPEDAHRDQPPPTPSLHKAAKDFRSTRGGVASATAGRAIDRLPGPQHTSLRRVFLVGNNRLAPRRWMPRQEMRDQLPEVKQQQQTALMHAQTVVPSQTKPCKQARLQQADEPGESDLPEPLRGNGVLAHLPPRGMNAGAKPASGKWKPAAESSSKTLSTSAHDARRPLH